MERPQRKMHPIGMTGKMLMLGLAVVGVVVGCSSPPSSEGISTLCSQTLLEQPEIPVLQDASQHPLKITTRHGEGLVLLRVAQGCETGVPITITPPHCVHLLGAVRGTNGQPIALALQAQRPGCDYTVTAAGRLAAHVVVH